MTQWRKGYLILWTGDVVEMRIRKDIALCRAWGGYSASGRFAVFKAPGGWALIDPRVPCNTSKWQRTHTSLDAAIMEARMRL